MNIFVTDRCPIKSAQNLDDKRVRHMPKECLEMIAMYIYSVCGKLPFGIPLFFPRTTTMLELYEHPCSRWVRRKGENRWWLYRHLKALIEEYHYRFNSAHPQLPYLNELKKWGSYLKKVNKEPNNFQNSSIFKLTNVIQCYRDTMMVKWNHMDQIEPVWTKRGKPSWSNTQEEIDFSSIEEDYINDIPF